VNPNVRVDRLSRPDRFRFVADEAVAARDTR
jgi:hypothetical protein